MILTFKSVSCNHNKKYFIYLRVTYESPRLVSGVRDTSYPFNIKAGAYRKSFALDETIQLRARNKTHIDIGFVQYVTLNDAKY